jgi:hypothetical protein
MVGYAIFFGPCAKANVRHPTGYQIKPSYDNSCQVLERFLASISVW